jgi:hypothetical protein
MAQREGQGLQIAVICFAMLTIILAITTYIFYAQSATAGKDLEASRKSLADQQGQNNKLMYRVLAMKHALGVGDVTAADVEVAKGKAGGDDAEVKELMDKFGADMALAGDQATPEGPRNYHTLVTVLLNSLARKNASLADANDQLRQSQAAKDALEKAEHDRAQVAVDSSNKATQEAQSLAQQYNEDREKNAKEKDLLVAKIDTVSKGAKDEQQKVIQEKDEFAKTARTQAETIRVLQGHIDEYKANLASPFEHPDGIVNFVSQQQRRVWIDVGSADGLIRQTTFAVYDHNESGISSAKPKARIEVVILGEHMSEARILEDKPGNPIIKGDVIYTPTWSPGQRVHFALAMKMDVNKDGVDDYEMVKNIIKMNGGEIDAELRPDGTRHGNLTVGTRYFVQGERPSELTSPDLQTAFNVFEADRVKNGIEKISVEKLLSMMGWRAEERTVELESPRSSDVFRTRTPGKTQPAGKAAPASESGAPAGGSPASRPPAAGATDPFATPAAPATPPATVDPFAAPASSAPVADPFATP